MIFIKVDTQWALSCAAVGDEMTDVMMDQNLEEWLYLFKLYFMWPPHYNGKN